MRLQYQEMSRRWSEMHVGYLRARVAFGTELNYTELSVYFWWSLCTLYLHACQVRVTVGDSGPVSYTHLRAHETA